MSSTENAAPVPDTPSGAMIRTLAGITMLSGFLVVLVFQLTKPMIEENQRQAIESAVYEVIPGAVEKREFVVTETGIVPAESGAAGITIHAGYDADGKLLRIATDASAIGYAGPIDLLYSYEPACRCIRAIKVLKMTETPGLGDKIITDPVFVANFDRLDARLDESGGKLAHPIVTVKNGSKKKDWEIDAISGATISSKAVGRALDASAEALLPKLSAHLADIQPQPSAAGQ
ncbi:MAG: FMN-binding protein [Gammaproteobacteria bacterium]